MVAEAESVIAQVDAAAEESAAKSKEESAGRRARDNVIAGAVLTGVGAASAPAIILPIELDSQAVRGEGIGLWACTGGLLLITGLVTLIVGLVRRRRTRERRYLWQRPATAR